jgi:hypothetical protein
MIPVYVIQFLRRVISFTLSAMSDDFAVSMIIFMISVLLHQLYVL